MRSLDTQLMKMADDKAAVKGTYYGQNFTGTVVSSRQISVGAHREEVTIDLDQPITLWSSSVRDSIIIRADMLEEGASYTLELI